MEASPAFSIYLPVLSGRTCVSWFCHSGAGRPVLLFQENRFWWPCKPHKGSCPVQHLQHLPVLPGFLNLCHTSTVFRDLGWALMLLWVLEGGACSSTLPWQQEVLQGKIPFPTLRTHSYLGLIELVRDIQQDSCSRVYKRKLSCPSCFACEG